MLRKLVGIILLVGMVLLASTAFAFDLLPEVRERRTPYVPITKIEQRQVIAVIDSGADFDHPDLKSFFCDGGHRDFTGMGLNDTYGHGTHIASLIVNGLDPKKYCIIILRYWKPNEGSDNFDNEIRALIWAGKQGAILVNFSSGGPYTDDTERRAIRDLVMSGTKVVVAAGNNGRDLGKRCDYNPACAFSGEGFYVVENLNNMKVRTPSSNYGGPVNASAPGLSQYGALPGGKRGTMSGTSQAAANFSNKLLGGKGESWAK